MRSELEKLAVSFAVRSPTGLDVPEQLRSAARRRATSRRGWSPKDPTLWGPDAESEAAIRLGWLDLPATLAASCSPGWPS